MLLEIKKRPWREKFLRIAFKLYKPTGKADFVRNFLIRWQVWPQLGTVAGFANTKLTDNAFQTSKLAASGLLLIRSTNNRFPSSMWVFPVHSILLFTLNKEDQKIVDAIFFFFWGGGGFSRWSSLKSKCDSRFDNGIIVKYTWYLVRFFFTEGWEIHASSMDGRKPAGHIKVRCLWQVMWTGHPVKYLF